MANDNVFTNRNLIIRSSTLQAQKFSKIDTHVDNDEWF